MVNLTQTDVSVERESVSKPPRTLQLERGAAVGRYVILDVVGEGGMGIVYAAYDPELDRKLALKLLRTASSERRAERRRLRLIREAQAMARLSHANVITVHDVGTIDDQVFVAMEFIEGCSLGEWIRLEHEWRRVVDVFAQAGKGLAAAHAAGLVHRDFKPDNVMLTDEHRAVVTDFGLARAAGRRGASESRDPDGMASKSRASLSTTVTAAGAIMGTPAYMSPEQHEGRPVDARSDQFAFAVALYEALYGVRPFPGDDVASLAYNVGAGNVRPAPSRSHVPSWLRQVLLRALSVEPAERFPSMVELLEALHRDRSSGRRWPWAAFGFAALAGAGVGAGLWLGGGEDPCSGGEAQAESVMGTQARRPAQAAFEGSGLPFAEQGWAAVDRALGAYQASWMEAYGAVCKAGRSPANPGFVARDACLDRSLDDAAAVLAVLEGGDPRALEQALHAVVVLPSPSRCTAPVVAPPTEAIALYAELSHTAALQRTGLSEQGLDIAQALTERAGLVRDDGLRAEALLWLARLQRTAGRLEQSEFNARESLGVALGSGNDAVAADAAVILVGLIGADGQRAREAEGWDGVAVALQQRSAATPADRAKLLWARARMLEASGRADAARRPLEEAAATLEEAYGGHDLRVAEAWAALGWHALRARDHGRARPWFERALGVAEVALGPDHPRTAAWVHALGEVWMLEGRLDRAAITLADALRVREQYGEAEPRAQTLLMLASIHMARGELDDAEQTLVAVGDIDGLSGTQRGQAVVGLSRLALRRGDLDGAMRGAAASRAGLGTPETVHQRRSLDAITADAMLRQGNVDAAEVLIDETIAALERGGGDATPALAEPLTVRGELLLTRMHPARALGDLERALSLRAARDAYGTARTEYALARALDAVDPHSMRAAELAGEALGRLDVREPLYAEVQRWLAER